MNAITPAPGSELFTRFAETTSRFASQTQRLMDIAGGQAARLRAGMPQLPTGPQPLPLRSPAALASDFSAYMIDTLQRSALFWDVMRRAGNAFVEHERAGCPPVLFFQYETLVDGRSLPRPVNYALVRIVPPADAPETDPEMRPFIIIDPRAGHGSGIGGFKSDSQVGVALQRRHPVYFVIFFRDPEPGQTILDVTAAEGVFLQHVQELHPKAPKPVVVGNCQGGWAVMMLGASHPDLIGPLVLNGAPLSYWAGQTGRNPMRYTGGLVGGAWPASLMADLGNGRFDGAGLVMNFESLSPANTWFRKYYDLYAKVDTEAPRFLEFERWWGGFFLMNAEEIGWIVKNLFIGDRFAQGGLRSGARGTFDMRAVRSPVIVFASAGDNITPPGQALRWIADVYRDEQEVRTLGQTIVYLLHEDVGHLGIFVSGKVAKKEHAEIANTLEMIEAVAPGLYEMQITRHADEGSNTPYHVELIERSMADIRSLAGEASNEAFPAVAKVSQLNEMVYEMAVRPVVRALATEAYAEFRRQTHPARLRRTLFSDANPFMPLATMAAEMVRPHRAPAAPDNVFLGMERAAADAVEAGMNRWRDLQDAWSELAFHAVYGGLAALGVADGDSQEAAPVLDPQIAEEVARKAGDDAAVGGYAEAVVRMMVLLADARGGVRRSRLARSNALLTGTEPFSAMTGRARQEMIRAQSLIVTLQPERALLTLPLLLPTPEDREKAMTAVTAVAGPEADLGEPARVMLARQREVLGLG